LDQLYRMYRGGTSQNVQAESIAALILQPQQWDDGYQRSRQRREGLAYEQKE